MTPALGYAAQDPQSPLSPFRFERRALRPDDARIEILYCGICHTDIHQARNDWGASQYPLVPGHEIVGRVIEVGAAVTKVKPGDLAAVGCMVDSCRTCPSCGEGLEQYCERGGPTFTYNSTDRHDGQLNQGGYCDNIVVSEAFVLTLPAGLDPAAAAPLLCAGITTYSPIRHWKIGRGHRLGVVGLGGLGHMAIKFGKALGAEVTLFTTSSSKEAEARRLGATSVVLSGDKAQMKAAASTLDFIIDTVPIKHDLNPYLRMLKRDGTLILVGLLETIEPGIDAGRLAFGRKSVAGSGIGGIAETQEMLEFCAAHGIVADVEIVPIQRVENAFERMLKSEVRYRFVIDMASLKGAA